MYAKGTQSRITISIPKASHKKLKALAEELGKSMREVIIESLEKHLQPDNYPNKTTLRTIKKIEKRKGLIKAKNAEDLFRKLRI